MKLTGTGWRVARGVLLALVGLFFSCAVASVAERRADGSIVIGYLADGAESIVSERRADAMLKARTACAGREVVIEREWDSLGNSGFGPQNNRQLLIRCVDEAARSEAVLARVRAETGCAQPTVESTAEVSGSTLFRLNACETRIVCEVRGVEVSCRRALSEPVPNR